MTALTLYFWAIFTDGDWLNDYATHLPHAIQPLVLTLGHLLAILIGA